jgi:NADPH:quinone reductase-like Zn-dependent oxidoreductase
MRNLSVYGGLPPSPAGPHLRPIKLDGLTLPCGLVETPPPVFRPESPEHRRSVLVRVRAVSCNYRDRTIIHRLGKVSGESHFPIGSELAAEVVAIGADVQSLRPHDSVISNHHYVGRVAGDDGVTEGVITNKGSRELQVFAERKLLRVPETMSPEVGASLSLGAQTAYSMVRKIDVGPGDPVLVTSGSSNTSLFVISTLRARGVAVYTSTSSERFHDRLAALGVERSFALGLPREGFPGTSALVAAAQAIGGFAAVVDPFFDLHLDMAMGLLRPFGRYITCGLAGQNPHLIAQSGSRGVNPIAVLGTAIVKNLSIIGNCLGVREDLEQAVADHAAGKLSPIIDSVFTDDDVSTFLDRTFNDRQRFGKVVFRYAS